MSGTQKTQPRYIWDMILKSSQSETTEVCSCLLTAHSLQGNKSHIVFQLVGQTVHMSHQTNSATFQKRSVG